MIDHFKTAGIKAPERLSLRNSTVIAIGYPKIEPLGYRQFWENTHENEMEEIRHIQRTYIKLLAAETKMSEAQLKKMINKKINVYLSAEEAVELGIADEVF